MTLRFPQLWLLIAFLAASASGCSSADFKVAGAGPDEVEDSSADLGSEADLPFVPDDASVPETGKFETGSDVALSDAKPDAAHDATTEATVDAAPEATPDAAHDAVLDAAPPTYEAGSLVFLVLYMGTGPAVLQGDIDFGPAVSTWCTPRHDGFCVPPLCSMKPIIYAGQKGFVCSISSGDFPKVTSPALSGHVVSFDIALFDATAPDHTVWACDHSPAPYGGDGVDLAKPRVFQVQSDLTWKELSYLEVPKEGFTAPTPYLKGRLTVP